VAETLVITGAGAAAEFTETLSNVAVVNAVVSPLVTANPIYTLCAMLMVWLVPTCTQFTPSEDAKLLKVLPLLVIFSQYGSVTVKLPGSTVLPPGADRSSKNTPL
jgi:hypothetical protein